MGRSLRYAGGSSSSDANANALVGYIEDCDELTNCRGSSLSSTVCPTIEVDICFDLLAMYSVTADLGKKICKDASKR